MPPDHSGRYQTRRGKLDIDSQRPQHQQQQRDIGIGDGQQDALAQRGLIDVDGAVREVQSLLAAVEARDFPPFELSEQRRGVGRDQVDQVLIERLALGIGTLSRTVFSAAGTFRPR